MKKIGRKRPEGREWRDGSERKERREGIDGIQEFS